MSDLIPCRRVQLDPDREWSKFEEGDYNKNLLGTWWFRPPGGQMGHLDGWTITEHEDGTITVSPSILEYNNDRSVRCHGFLEHGMWRKV